MRILTQLPSFIRPMLARRGAPFDDDAYLFEVKWDGIRAMAYIERDTYRLLSRGGQDITCAFPELSELANLPAGTLLDGELVVLDRGRPHLALVQSRHRLRSPHQIRLRAKNRPCTYVVFDQLFERFGSLMSQPLSFRRELLRTHLARSAPARVFLSEGILGRGRALYRAVLERQLEGVMAKRLTSLYRPGCRSDAWIKIKPASDRGCIRSVKYRKRKRLA
jgi:ATP-dependent DNA ligase